MSNKNRRNRKTASVSSSESSNIPNSPVDSSARKGVFFYLKSRLRMVGIISFLALGVLGATLKYLDEDAQREIARRNASKGKVGNQEESFLNKINPFLSPPDPTPTPQLSKEYIYAGSRLLAVEDANAASAPPADLAIWRPSTGYWWVMKPDGNVQDSIGWGQNGDKVLPGDFDGDGKTDFSVYRPATATSSAVWWIIRSSTQDTSYYSIPFGAVDDIPAPADYDGDGKTDIAIYRAGVWYIQQSSNLATIYPQFGTAGDIPTPKDFDGDGRADLAVWRSSNSTYYSANSSNGQVLTVNFNQSSTKPVPADYDGDGRADYAIRSGAEWLIRQSSNNQTQTVVWQNAADQAVQNDYDGDGKVDVAVFRNADSSTGAGDAGNWYIRNSSNGQVRFEHWGMAGDIAVPAYYRR